MVPRAEGEGSCCCAVSSNELNFTCEDYPNILSEIQTSGVFSPRGPGVSVRSMQSLNCCEWVRSQQRQGLPSEEAAGSVEVVCVFSLYLDFSIAVVPAAQTSPKT